MFKITSREWERIHFTNKCTINGQKQIMCYSLQGTSLVPVEIDDIEGAEMGIYSFTECGVKFTVQAYTVGQAYDIIKACGHSQALINDFKRERSL